MRYIGSKKNLLKEIESVIKPFKKFNSFCDLFSGTAIVAQHFKKDFKVISNDLLYFSYVFQKVAHAMHKERETLKKSDLSKIAEKRFIKIDSKSNLKQCSRSLGPAATSSSSIQEPRSQPNF